MTALVVHGGAGDMPAERHARVLEGVRRAAALAHPLLAVSALDAVTVAVKCLEDDPEFNAGIGSVLTRDGTVETDAAIMDGTSQRVGAVGAVPDMANPVLVARALLDRCDHAMLCGPSAWEFAAELGIAPAAPGSLVTERARNRLATKGTVGAVARDAHGRFAAATSTGGITGKRRGRIGDSPIPGAGTWADARCALSATGDGEAIMRVALARTISMRIDRGLRDAIIASLHDLAMITGGSAGVIGIDATDVLGVQLAATMPIAGFDRARPFESLGQRV